MGPDYLILDTAQSIIDFRAKLNDLGVKGEMTTETIVENLIPYLQDEQILYGCLQEYARELGQLLESQHRPEVIEEFVYAVHELGSDIIYQLQDMVAYDDAGALWYDFFGFCGDDIVLIRSTLCKPLPRNSP